MKQLAFVSLAVTAAFSTMGCKKSEPTKAAEPASGSAVTIKLPQAPAPDAAAPVAAPQPFSATLEGKPYKFLSAKIDTATQQDSIELSTRAGGCDRDYQEGDTLVSVSIPRGPGGKHFAPGPLFVSVLMTNEKEKFEEDYANGVITIEPGEWKVGNKIKGTLRFKDRDEADDGSMKEYVGEGSFEAVVCGLASDDYAYQVLPETADAGPAKGEADGIPFTFKSGVAMLTHDDDNNVDRIQAIELFDTDVTCAEREMKGPKVTLYSPGGAQAGEPIVGAPQTTTIYWDAPGKDHRTVYGPNWVKFDAIELKEGAVIKGTVHAEAAAKDVRDDPTKAARLSGSFTATVCKF